MNVIKNEKDKNKYKSIMFVDKGYDTLRNYLTALIKYYYSATPYPFKQGIVIGLPQITATQEIKSKEELMGRIKAYMMILGINDIAVNLDNGSIITFELKGDK